MPDPSDIPASGKAQASAPRLRIGFLLAPRFTLSAFATFVDVLRLAADDGDGSRPIRCRWAILSHDLAPVQSSCGMRIEPDERLGEEIAAFVSLALGSAVTGEALQAFAAERLARYKQPREVTVLDGLPKNATGKILRRELRQG